MTIDRLNNFIRQFRAILSHGCHITKNVKLSLDKCIFFEYNVINM